ncbi:hypothetical protein ES708_14261 [subsurface metagenome]
MQCKDTDERARLQDVVEHHGASSDIVHNWVKESNRETDHIREPSNAPLQNIQPDTPPNPMYPCAACEVPVDIINLKIVRLCEECHHLIFSDIELEKQKALIASLNKNVPICQE